MTSHARLRLAVLISGSGTNLQAILNRFNAGDERDVARVELVISDRNTARGLDRARRAGAEPTVILPSDFASDELFGEELMRCFKRHDIEYVVLAGYLRMIPLTVVRAWRNRIINIHPALLPLFGGRGMYGKRVHEAVLASGMKVSGATVHFVDEEFDHGPIIAQRAVPVYSDDTAASLAARVLEVEHVLLPEVIGSIADGRVSVRKGIVEVKRLAAEEPDNNS